MSNSLRPHGLQHARLFPVLHSAPVYVHWIGDVSNHLILCCPLLLLLSLFPNFKVFSNVSFLCIRWPKYWRFSFIISPSNEYSRLISFRIDWFDLLAVQGTLNSLLQHRNSKASILQNPAFFMDQLSHPYMTTRKTFDYMESFCHFYLIFHYVVAISGEMYEGDCRTTNEPLNF